MDRAQIDRFRSLLAEQRAELVALSAGSAQSRAPVTLDQQSVGRVSRIDAMQSQAMAAAQERQRATDIVRIDQALRRIEADEFGYCVECGEEIAVKRLEIDPTAALCISCAGRG